MSSLPAPDLRPLSVLLIEDNPGDALLLSTYAADFAHQALALDVVSSLAEGITAVTAGDHDLVLLDLGLPDSQGLPTLLGVVEAAPETPVVVLTGYDDRELASACLAQGAEDYAIKGQVEPFIGWIVHNAVARFASRKRLDHLNRVLEALRSINQLVIREDDPLKLVQRACELLVDKRGYRGAAMLLTGADGRLAWRQARWGDLDAGALSKLDSGWAPECHHRAQSPPSAEADVRLLTADQCGDCPLAPPDRGGLAACMLVRHREHVFGSLSVAVPEGIVVDDEERSLLAEIARDLGFALNAIEGERQRLEGERKLRDSERLLENTGRVARVGGWSYELATERVRWTAVTREIHEVADDFEPQLNDALAFYHPDGRPLLEAALDKATKRGDPYNLELRFTTAKGRELRVQARCTPEVEDGQVLRLVGTFQDVTQRYEAEQERAQLEAQLRQAQRMEAIGQLAGGVAHDFNNLLTVINSYADLVEEKLPPDDPLRGKVRQIGDAGSRAAGLTRQLLAFSRKQLLEPKRLELERVVGGVQKLLRRLIGEDVAIEVDQQPGLWSVLADQGQLEQVLMNLAVNARDAMPRGGRFAIALANSPHKGRSSDEPALDGDYVRLTVSDTGCGIAPEIRARIFEPFFTTKAEGQGTGLGLATVYGIVKQSGGELVVESEPGQGTTFRLYLPRAAHVEGSKEAARRADDTPTSSRGEGILVVEDEAAVRELVARILGRAGYRVYTAANGREALRTFRRHADEITLLLTDVVMPQMSGKELVDQLASDRPTLKVLYMSGYTGNVIARQGALEAGAQLLRKPFRGSTLLQKVREVLDG
jgi:signal transduction histidine kinase/DNA-binding response OmpR family regulator